MNKIFNIAAICCLLIMLGCSTDNSATSGMLVVKVSPYESGKLSAPMVDGNIYYDDPSSYVSSISTEIPFGGVSIDAKPNANSYFDGWSGDIVSKENPINFTMNSDMNLIANFIVFKTVNINQIGEGSVSIKTSFNEQLKIQTLEISAVPKDLWEFIGWTGDIERQDNPYILTRNFDDTRELVITANFKQIPREYQGPKIESYTFAPQEIDITNSSQVVIVAAHVTDESGVGEIPIVYIQKSSNSSATQQTGYLKRISGDAKDGLYEVQITIPQGLEPGEWEVFSNSFYDIFRNSSIWPIYPTSEKKKLTVRNNNKGDFEGPKIESYTFAPQEIDITNSSQVVTVTAHVTDESGVGGIPIVYIQKSSNSSATQQTGYLKRISGDAKDGLYEVQITIPQGLESGEWEVFSNSFYDIFRNSSIWPIYPTSEKKKLTVISK